MQEYKVAIIGAGRMGKVLAQKWSEHFSVLIYDCEPEKLCFTENNIIPVQDLHDVLQAKILVPALPPQGVKELQTDLKGKLIINIATSLSKEELATEIKECPFCNRI